MRTPNVHPKARGLKGLLVRLAELGHPCEIVPYDHLARKQFQSLLTAVRATYDHLPDGMGTLNTERTKSLNALLQKARHKGVPVAGSRMEAAAAYEFAASQPSVFHRYEEITSGSGGPALRVLRSSVSLHRESLRLQYAMRAFARASGRPAPGAICYVSKYTRSPPYLYVDETVSPIPTVKLAAPLLQDDQVRNCVQSLGAFALSGTPSSLLELARTPGGQMLRPSFCILAGEQCPEKVEQELAVTFEAQCFQLYVAREFGLLGFLCPYDTHFHLFSIDFEFANDGSGELLVSDITNDLIMFHRYQTGDKGDVGAHSMCSHHPWPTMTNFRGRAFGKDYYPPE